MYLDRMSNGLGVKFLYIFKIALLLKWCWWFEIEREALWNKVIRGKYEE